MIKAALLDAACRGELVLSADAGISWKGSGLGGGCRATAAAGLARIQPSASRATSCPPTPGRRSAPSHQRSEESGGMSAAGARAPPGGPGTGGEHCIPVPVSTLVASCLPSHGGDAQAVKVVCAELSRADRAPSRAPVKSTTPTGGRPPLSGWSRLADGLVVDFATGGSGGRHRWGITTSRETIP
jgi:hypothetical protein